MNKWVLCVTVHPGFSAEECFKRIDHNLKGLLRKRHLPLVVSALNFLSNSVCNALNV